MSSGFFYSGAPFLPATLAGGGGPAFTPQLVENVSSAYYSRSVTLSGSGNSSGLGSLAMILDVTASADSTDRYLLSFSANNIRLIRNSSNGLTIQLRNPTNGNLLQWVSSGLDLSNAGPKIHLAVNWDTQQASGSKQLNVFVSGASQAGTLTDGIIAFNVDWTFAANTIMVRSDVTSQANAMFGEFMIWYGVKIDWSQASNIQKVWSNGNPVDPGADGSRVTGSTPTCYYSCRPSDLASAILTDRSGRGNHLTQPGVGWLAREKNVLIGFGDSLMAGTAATGLFGWFSQLGGLTAEGKRYLDFGVGGTTSSQIRDNFLANYAPLAALYPNESEWWFNGGRNNIAVAPATVVGNFQSMITALQSLLPARNYFIQSVPNGTSEGNPSTAYTQITGINSALAAAFPGRVFDVRAYLIANGLSDAGINSGNAANWTQDMIDVAADTVPIDLRADPIHWTDAGHKSAAKGTQAFRVAFGLT